MADVNNNININVTGNADEQLNRIGSGLDNLQANQTRVTQTTSSLSRETNNLNKGLIQNGGAMGLLSAATGGLAMDFKDALEATEGLGVSLKGLRGAIIATGIGALAIVVLELVTNWEKWSGVIDGSTKRLEANKKALGELNAEKERFTAQTTYELELAKIQGATEEELHNQRVRQIQQNIELLEQQKIQAEENYRIQLANDRDSEETENARLERNRIGLEIKNLEREALLSYNALLASKEAKNALDEKNKKLKISKDTIEATKKAQDELNKSFVEAEKGIAALKSINELLRGVTTAELTSDYAKWKQLTDAYYNTSDAAKVVRKSLDELKKASLDPKQLERKKQLEEELVYYEGNFKVINKLIDIQKDYISRKDRITQKSNDEAIAIDILSLKYDQLSNSIYDYERADFTTSKSDTSNERLLRINELLEKRIEIIKKTTETNMNSVSINKSQLREETMNLRGRNAEIEKTKVGIETMGDVIKRADFMRSAGLIPEFDSELQEKMYKEYFDNIDKINDYKRQSDAENANYDKIVAEQDLSLNQAVLDARLQQERIYLDLKLEAQENYYNAVQTLESEVYSFLDQLQNAQIIKDKNVRNILLVAQKGAEIANVVVGTVKENNRLKTQATQYKINAGLNYGLAASLATVDPAAAAAYGAAGSNYASAAAASAAAIPINWGIAGASIASILATTLTSWNKSSGGSSGGSVGGGGPQAQFNIVGSSGTNQLAASIAAQQNQPVNAFVVGSDMTTQQALDRNRITNATFL